MSTNPNTNHNSDTVNSPRDYSNEVSYRDGYIHGATTERRLNEESYIESDRDRGTGNGLVLGIIIATLAALGIGSAYLLTQRNEPASRTQPSTQIIPIPVPNNSQPQRSEPQSSKKETTIIERTVDKTKEVVPVPQKQEPAKQVEPEKQAPAAPDININLNSQDKQDTDAKASPDQPQTEAPDKQSASEDK